MDAFLADVATGTPQSMFFKLAGETGEEAAAFGQIR